MPACGCGTRHSATGILCCRHKESERDFEAFFRDSPTGRWAFLFYRRHQHHIIDGIRQEMPSVVGYERVWICLTAQSAQRYTLNVDFHPPRRITIQVRQEGHVRASGSVPSPLAITCRSTDVFSGTNVSTGFAKINNFRAEAARLDPGVFGGELPVDSGLTDVSFSSPGRAYGTGGLICQDACIRRCRRAS